VCAREDGIRRSKDLRAEIGKFPNSTNERKQMSKMTTNKRISLISVAALGFGLLSIVPASANSLVASTVIATGNYNTLSSTDTNPVAVDHILNIASEISVSGNTVTLADGTTAAAATVKSIGLLSVSDIAGGLVAGTTQTATLLSSGTLTLITSAGAATVVMGTVTGGTISGTGIAAAGGFSPTAVTYGDNNSDFVFSVRPNPGVTNMVVELYATNLAGATPASVLAGTDAGILTGRINVTVVSASVAGTLSATTSGVFYDSDGTASSRTSDEVYSGRGTSNYDTAQYANVRARDAYGSALTTGLLTASATNGALVKIGSGVTTPTATSDFYSAALDNVIVTVAAPARAGLSTVVTVSHNGTVIGTKSYTFRGEVASITLSSAVNGLRNNSTAGTNTMTVVFADSAGTALPTATTAVPSAAFGTSASSAYALALTTDATTSVPAGVVTFTCPDLSSTGNAIATYVNVSGTVITSNALPVSCSKIAWKYTASYDKAVYAPGEIATLTIALTDVDGRAAADSLTSASDNATDDVVVISESQMTKVGAAHVADDTRSTNGKLTYKYIVGQNEGSYSNSINLPQVNTNNSLGTTGAVTAGFTIKSATATVTNADVLKSIVSLIASINKQIQALQKLILRR
jgi:hypothetical protein